MLFDVKTILFIKKGNDSFLSLLSKFCIMKKYSIIILSILFILCFFSFDADAQCAMCKAAAEQSDQKGLNKGILFLFLSPYIIVGTMSYLWWKNRKVENEDELTQLNTEQFN